MLEQLLIVDKGDVQVTAFRVPSSGDCRDAGFSIGIFPDYSVFFVATNLLLKTFWVRQSPPTVSTTIVLFSTRPYLVSTTMAQGFKPAKAKKATASPKSGSKAKSGPKRGRT